MNNSEWFDLVSTDKVFQTEMEKQFETLKTLLPMWHRVHPKKKPEKGKPEEPSEMEILFSHIDLWMKGAVNNATIEQCRRNAWAFRCSEMATPSLSSFYFVQALSSFFNDAYPSAAFPKFISLIELEENGHPQNCGCMVCTFVRKNYP
jgi:hypothetical protein